MSIEKFNPVGYIAQTKNGNDYKKSNMGKTVGFIAGIAAEATANQLGKKYKSLSAETVLNKDLKLNVPNKWIKPITGLLMLTGVLTYTGIGALVDSFVNKRRAKKADQQAQALTDAVNGIDKQ